jgi:hypothetical protein
MSVNFVRNSFLSCRAHKKERDKKGKKKEKEKEKENKGREEETFEVESRRGFAFDRDVKERGISRLLHSFMTGVEHVAVPESRHEHGLTSADSCRSRR